MTVGPFLNLKPNHYGAILIDPPWNFKTWSVRGESKSASKHYDILDPEALLALPVGDLAAKDCALFIWVTDPTLPFALECLKSWRFVYKTVAFTWVKTTKNDKYHVGMGYWTRANPEMCLLATRGKPQRQSKAVRQLIVAPRREHSRKPEEIRRRIQALVPGPYCELFARQRAPGFDSWGNEVSKFGRAK